MEELKEKVEGRRRTDKTKGRSRNSYEGHGGNGAQRRKEELEGRDGRREGEREGGWEGTKRRVNEIVWRGF